MIPPEESRFSTVVLIANSDWDSFWFQRQEFATRFAEAGYDVVYVNRSFQRFPKVHHILRRLLPNKGKGSLKNERPNNLRVVTPYWLPPIQGLNTINKAFLSVTRRQIEPVEDALVITYLPTYAAADFIEMIDPLRTVYVNVHNYDGADVLEDLLRAEREIARDVDVLMADSQFNRQRLEEISGGRHVYPALPGVDYDQFQAAYRGDEVERREVIMFYGGIGPHVDFEVYEALAETYDVRFVGVVNPEIEGEVPDSIEILPPVKNHELPAVLEQADVLTIFYRETEFVRGKIPAKFFECLATQKPTLVSGLREADAYPESVYEIGGSAERAAEIIESLPDTETEDRLHQRRSIAQSADWEDRFDHFSSIVMGDQRS